MAAPPGEGTTVWSLAASPKYDALCLLNVLGDDPFYVGFYPTEFEEFDRRLGPDERAACRSLRRIIKDEGHGIVSGLLSLVLSVVDGDGLEETITALRSDSGIRDRFARSGHWDGPAWETFVRARPHATVALEGLRRSGFEEYWRRNVLPDVQAQVARLAPVVRRYDIVPAVEELLGRRLAGREITVYLLRYSMPHGIRITGRRLLTHVDYPFSTVVRNAIHEMLHPPYDAADPAVRAAVERVGRDPLVEEKVRHHDPSFGYNTAEGYVEEDCVQALEQVVAERFGEGGDPRGYWTVQDGGMHILAAAIYDRFRRAVVPKGPLPAFAPWFLRSVHAGDLDGARLAGTVRRFFGPTD
jgi:hypothetical protein